MLPAPALAYAFIPDLTEVPPPPGRGRLGKFGMTEFLVDQEFLF